MNQVTSHHRVDWIDMCKFIGIFFMVWAHSGDSASLDKYIHVFHMPIFFFLSGFTFRINESTTLIQFITKKARTILVPYFVFALINYFVWCVYYVSTNQQIKVSLVQLLQSTVSSNTINSPFSGVQWFLTCLFLVEVMFFMLVRLTHGVKTIMYAGVGLFALAGAMIGPIIGTRLFWGLDTALTAIVFFAVGFMISKLDLAKIRKQIRIHNVVLSMILFAVSLILGFANSTVNMRTIQYGNLFYFYSAAITTIAFYVMLSQQICNSWLCGTTFYKIICYIGRNSIVVLLLNQLYIQMLKKLPVAELVVLYSDLNINLIGLILALIVLLLMLPTIALLTKFAPELIGKKKMSKIHS